MAGKNIFVLGLTDVQRRELETVRGAEGYAFHNVLDYERLVNTAHVDFEPLLDAARAELAASGAGVDAIIAHWDFPVSVMAPILAAEHGLPTPTLESVLKCEHKYWGRLEQQASVPECVPPFAAFDPFDEDALATIGMEFPFWIKPVKAHSSNLGFRIENEADFSGAIVRIREHIRDIGNAFNEVLARVDLPPELAGWDGNTCLAEQYVEGIQIAPEGSMFRGEFNVHGILDMHKDASGTSFARLDYPASSVPERVQRRVVELTERCIRGVGFDDGCFNAEFIWDEAADRLWLVEVNTRISQAHSDLFAKVDGMSNHEVAIDIALGRRPWMPYRQGRFAVAAQCMVFWDEDAVVTRVPTAEDKAAIRERHPDTIVTLQVRVGDRLSELPGQNSYRYIVGKLYIGADSQEQLLERYAAVVDELPFEFAPVDGEGPGPDAGATNREEQA